jgi:hypothetical protein
MVVATNHVDENNSDKGRFRCLLAQEDGMVCPVPAVIDCSDRGGVVKAITFADYGAEKPHLLRHLMLQIIMLPRQARDKRSESTQNRGACFAGAPTGSCGGFAHGNCSATDSMEVVRKLCVVRMRSF